VLDITSEVTNNGEQGLLGLTFSPDGDRMYVYFTNKQGDQVVREYAFTTRATNPRLVLQMDDPYGNHNGGNILFGPDGFLYIGTGDGGSAGDPQNRAQNLNDLLGKILRIDPSKRTGSLAYGIPNSNPFVGKDGRDEIWAYGLRNPWRFSFDRDTGALWIADVGQGEWEEVNVASGSSNGGENYGWRRMEGTHSFEGGSPPSNHKGPIYEYSHADGSCSVTGGFAYRGSKIPAMRGSYVFGDFCVGKLRAFATRRGRAINHRFLGPKVGSLASFAEDRNGELYVLSLGGGVYRIDPA
jgi:glucose/arabinose dehydrogenase